MHNTKVIKVFYCCSDSAQDEEMRKQLEKHLRALEREGVIKNWDKGMISPGKEWETEIDRNLKAADIILVLISSEFTASDYHWDVLAKQAMEQHRAKTSRVITILLRPVDNYWKVAFPNVKVLPKDERGERPITEWRPYDKAFANITTGIREVAEELTDSNFLIKKSLRLLWAIVTVIAEFTLKAFIFLGMLMFSYLCPSRSRRRNRVRKIPIELVIIVVVGTMVMFFISRPSNILDISSSTPKSNVNSSKTGNPNGWIWIGMVNKTSGSFVGKPLILQTSNSEELPRITPAFVPSLGSTVTVKDELHLWTKKSLSGQTIVKLQKGQKLIILKVEPFSKVNKNSPYIKLKAQVRKCDSTCQK
ncbi:MAG: toll/interleukin-1 receptor domain-containing protein [Nostoc sp. CreGUA01]|nr:toll/interleukin-1 receptor domain-containing protein [Nostoc sp. CreGUA01]